MTSSGTPSEDQMSPLHAIVNVILRILVQHAILGLPVRERCARAILGGRVEPSAAVEEASATVRVVSMTKVASGEADEDDQRHNDRECARDEPGGGGRDGWESHHLPALEKRRGRFWKQAQAQAQARVQGQGAGGRNERTAELEMAACQGTGRKDARHGGGSEGDDDETKTRTDDRR